MSLAINITFSVGLPASTVFCLADQHVHNCECNYDWCRALNAGDKVDVMFVDHRKAFDES